MRSTPTENGVDQAEAFRVLREDGAEITLERHVVADENAITHSHRETHRFVIGVPDADREAASFEGGFEIANAEHLYTVLRNGIFVADDGDMPERECFEERSRTFLAYFCSEQYFVCQ